MARFIDAEKLEEILQALTEKFPGNVTLPMILQTVQAMGEDIIRCKDCANGCDSRLGFICGCCINQYGQIRIVNPNGYCSHADRKGEEDEHI